MIALDLLNDHLNDWKSHILDSDEVEVNRKIISLLVGIV